MTPLDAALGYASLLTLVAPDLDRATLVGTTLVLHICDAIICRLLATNHGRRRGPWTLLGLIAGVWTVALLFALPRRGGTRSRPAPMRSPSPGCD